MSKNLAIRICSALQSKGGKAYVVGGAVRDTILGIEPHDWDVATNFVPEESSAVLGPLGRVVYTGVKHVTITIIDKETYSFWRYFQ